MKELKIVPFILDSTVENGLIDYIFDSVREIHNLVLSELVEEISERRRPPGYYSQDYIIKRIMSVVAPREHLHALNYEFIPGLSKGIRSTILGYLNGNWPSVKFLVPEGKIFVGRGCLPEMFDRINQGLVFGNVTVPLSGGNALPDEEDINDMLMYRLESGVSVLHIRARLDKNSDIAIVGDPDYYEICTLKLERGRIIKCLDTADCEQTKTRLKQRLAVIYRAIGEIKYRKKNAGLLA